MNSERHRISRTIEEWTGYRRRRREWIVWFWSHLVVFGGTGFAILMMALCTWTLYQSLLDTREYARQNLENIALIVERDIKRNFELYALSLQAVVTGISEPQMLTLSPGLQRQLLFDGAANAQYLAAMLVLDEKGNISKDADRDLPRVGNFADRAYFQVQRDNPNLGLYISSPFASRLRNGAPSIALSRRLSHADGSFAGVAVLLIQVEYFQRLFAGLSLGSEASISLLNTDGTLIMRQPLLPSAVGQSFAHSVAFQHFTADQGTFSAITQLDGVPRLYVYRRIPGLPLILTVAEAQKDIYARWWRRAVLIGTLMLISGVGFIVLSFMLGAQLRRRVEAEASLERLARTDGLTGLNNRRTLGEILDGEWRRAQRTHRSFSLLFLDIDHFKAYNDTYGHPAGDKALATVAQCISTHIRQAVDSAARYGGEEFVIVMPDTGPEGAAAAAAKLVTAISALGIAHIKSQYGRVTASVGAASWDPARHPNVNAVIKAADEALYRAKAAGRNGTAVAD